MSVLTGEEVDKKLATMTEAANKAGAQLQTAKDALAEITAKSFEQISKAKDEMSVAKDNFHKLCMEFQEFKITILSSVNKDLRESKQQIKTSVGVPE